MKTLANNPAEWRLSTLLSLTTEQVHELACRASGTVTSYRLVLGRCLLALHHSKGYKDYGCSTAVHYGASVLGLEVRMARECKRVADRLQNLASLTLAAERGKIAWGKLREIVRVASPETEDYWLELAANYGSERLQRLVSLTPVGQLPGDDDLEQTCVTEFRIAASPELIRMFRRARRMFARERDESVSGAETLECLLASFFSSQVLEPEVLEELKEEAEKDLQAEKARQVPEVVEAREKAAAMGLLKCESDDCDGSCQSARPRGVIPEEQIAALLSKELEGWQNERLRFNPKSRHTTKAQKREILRRDGWCCQTPACPNRTWVQIHHLKPYSEGGTTVPDNLVCLCSGCHRNLHNGILKVRPDEDDKLIFTDESGRRLDHQADLELAGWLDFWSGWRGEQLDSHQARALSGDWAVFGDG